ncbi:hypothetical protein [Peribacillus frigoritolerans]|uniref:hypothetical protein n=1 Tax=Peribacillus frigoritolerans TaxID=450367 RepID=UPI00105A7D2A|nr:hypothetical protein [Peribacillus frigoritolerans]TDL79002.1 hypothetical protein E2R53_16305 [Peribacillus frigoritolerans]
MKLDAFPKNIVKTVRYIKRHATDKQILEIERLLKETIEDRLKELQKEEKQTTERRNMSL